MPPMTVLERLLNLLPSTLNDILCDLRLLRVGVEHDGCHERYLEGLFRDQLECHRPENLFYIVVLIVVGCQLRKVGCDFVRQSAVILGDLEQTSPNSRARRRLLALTLVTEALVVLVVLYTVALALRMMLDAGFRSSTSIALLLVEAAATTAAIVAPVRVTHCAECGLVDDVLIELVEGSILELARVFETHL